MLAQSIEGYMAKTYCVREIRYRMERVHYCEQTELASVAKVHVDCPWTLKRSGFAHEKEIRIFNLTPDKTPAGHGIGIKVKLSHLAEQIVLSPFNPEYVNDGIQKVVGKLTPALVEKVTQSDHMRKPTSTNAFLRDKENREGIESTCQNLAFLIKKKLLF
jgi:hypothetical protein